MQVLLGMLFNIDGVLKPYYNFCTCLYSSWYFVRDPQKVLQTTNKWSKDPFTWAKDNISKKELHKFFHDPPTPFNGELDGIKKASGIDDIISQMKAIRNKIVSFHKEEYTSIIDKIMKLDIKDNNNKALEAEAEKLNLGQKNDFSTMLNNLYKNPEYKKNDVEHLKNSAIEINKLVEKLKDKRELKLLKIINENIIKVTKLKDKKIELSAEEKKKYDKKLHTQVLKSKKSNNLQQAKAMALEIKKAYLADKSAITDLFYRTRFDKFIKLSKQNIDNRKKLKQLLEEKKKQFTNAFNDIKSFETSVYEEKGDDIYTEYSPALRRAISAKLDDLEEMLSNEKSNKDEIKKALDAIREPILEQKRQKLLAAKRADRWFVDMMNIMRMPALVFSAVQIYFFNFDRLYSNYWFLPVIKIPILSGMFYGFAVGALRGVGTNFFLKMFFDENISIVTIGSKIFNNYGQIYEFLKYQAGYGKPLKDGELPPEWPLTKQETIYLGAMIFTSFILPSLLSNAVAVAAVDTLSYAAQPVFYISVALPVILEFLVDKFDPFQSITNTSYAVSKIGVYGLGATGTILMLASGNFIPAAVVAATTYFIAAPVVDLLYRESEQKPDITDLPGMK